MDIVASRAGRLPLSLRDIASLLFCETVTTRAVCIPTGNVLASACWRDRRTKMIRRIVLGFAIVAGLSGAALMSAGLIAQPAAACTDPHTS